MKDKENNIDHTKHNSLKLDLREQKTIVRTVGSFRYPLWYELEPVPQLKAHNSRNEQDAELATCFTRIDSRRSSRVEVRIEASRKSPYPKRHHRKLVTKGKQENDVHLD